MGSSRENDSRRDEYVSGFGRIIRQYVKEEEERRRRTGVYRWKFEEREEVPSGEYKDLTGMQWFFILLGALSFLIAMISLINYLLIYSWLPFETAYSSWLFYKYGELFLVPGPQQDFLLVVFVILFLVSLISFLIVYYSRRTVRKSS
ncbi:MAG: hypothetical protein ACETWM_01590 [Candidatus Lokiarchaeia archaeon]